MKTTSEALINDLVQRTEKVKQEAEQLNSLPLEYLNRKPGAGSWSALECMEHLNRFSEFYLTEFKARIHRSPHARSEQFTSGWFGNYFANLVRPGENITKMPAPPDKNPSGTKLDKSTLRQFITHQEETLKVLEQARKVNLEKTRAGTSITRLIKLKLGDLLRVLVYHNQRHLQQAQKALSP
jgi:hypothetical protein